MLKLEADDAGKTKAERYRDSLEDPAVNKMNAGLGMTFKCNFCGEFHRNSEAGKVGNCYSALFRRIKDAVRNRYPDGAVAIESDSHRVNGTWEDTITADVSVEVDKITADANANLTTAGQSFKDAILDKLAVGRTFKVNAKQILAEKDPPVALTLLVDGAIAAIGDIPVLARKVKKEAHENFMRILKTAKAEFSFSKQSLTIHTDEKHGGNKRSFYTDMLKKYFLRDVGKDENDPANVCFNSGTFTSIKKEKNGSLVAVIAVMGYFIECRRMKKPVILSAPPKEHLPKGVDIEAALEKFEVDDD